MANKPTLRQVIKAVLGALVGVQSEQQRQQDFASTSPIPYIVVGLVVTLFFVVALIVVVKLVLA